MKRFIWILALFSIGGAGYWGWLQLNSNDSREDLVVQSDIVIKKSSDARVKAIAEEVLSISDVDYEVKLLELFPAEGYVGKDLYRRLASLQEWLDSLKVFTVDDLGLDARVYAEYVEYRFRFFQKRLRAREKIKKRHGDFDDFSKAYAVVRVEISREYLDKLEEVFGDKFDELVKFHQQFNDKIKSEGNNRYESFHTIEL